MNASILCVWEYVRKILTVTTALTTVSIIPAIALMMEFIALPMAENIDP